jgi:hypothetical protein
MLSREEILFFVAILVVVLVIYYMYYYNSTSSMPQMTENFTTTQVMPNPHAQNHTSITGKSSMTHTPAHNSTCHQNFTGMTHTEARDPHQCNNEIVHPHGSTKDYESLIYDNTTGTVMTGSQFMTTTGLVTPPWIAPAWDSQAHGPSSSGTLNPSDYENDPRMLYNKCSLSCCSPQYPTPHKGEVDPFACDEDGKKYMSSDYTCTNNTGGTGCLCVSPNQIPNSNVDYDKYYTKAK